jgi:phosphohistidine phosphatase SixA
MLVGHNPGLQELALTLAPSARQLRDSLPTGALATMSVTDETWSQLQPGRAELLSLVLPREL